MNLPVNFEDSPLMKEGYDRVWAAADANRLVVVITEILQRKFPNDIPVDLPPYGIERRRTGRDVQAQLRREVGGGYLHRGPGRRIGMIYGSRIEMKVPERRRVTRNDRSVALIPVPEQPSCGWNGILYWCRNELCATCGSFMKGGAFDSCFERELG
jgi:hypothetical protein